MRLTVLTARMAGLVTGVAIAAAGVTSWKVTGGTGILGADIWVISSPVGELELSPAGPFVSGSALEPGGRAVEGDLKVRNQTGSELSVRLRALPSLRDLDDVLMIRVELEGDALFVGRLGDLRSWSDRAFRLARGERRAVRVQTWLPPDVTDGYQGRIADISLELQAVPIP